MVPGRFVDGDHTPVVRKRDFMIRTKPTSRRVAAVAVLLTAFCAPIGLLSGCADSSTESGSAAPVNQKEVDAAQKGMQDFMASKKQAGKGARKP